MHSNLRNRLGVRKAGKLVFIYSIMNFFLGKFKHNFMRRTCGTCILVLQVIIFHFLSYIEVKQLKESERDCALVLDEMVITPQIEYDVSMSGEVTLPGRATHALVFMLAGISINMYNEPCTVSKLICSTCNFICNTEMIGSVLQ